MTAKEAIMTRMTNVLKGQAMYVREDDTISTQDKCTQMDVILDLMRFLNDYDENVQVLNKHIEEKKQKIKWEDGEER
ncbi:MAG: hypothetical protein ACI4VQ_05990 [Clostridia bacterium]